MKSTTDKLLHVFLYAAFLFSSSISYADAAMPLFACTLTDQAISDYTAGATKTSFITSTPKLYLVCSSDKINNGQKVKSVWIAASTNNVAPDNYKIDEKEVVVNFDEKNNQPATASFSLSKPTHGWPVGSYHVDLYIDGKLDQSVNFTIK